MLLLLLIRIAHVTAIKCWSGSIPMVYRNSETYPDGYCAVFKAKLSMWTYHFHVSTSELNTEFKNVCDNDNCDIFYTCQTDYCNAPPNAPPPFKLKVNATFEPSEKPIACWMNLFDQFEPFKSSNPVKSEDSFENGFFGIGFCYKAAVIINGTRHYMYGFSTEDDNLRAAEGKVDHYYEYFSCNTDYCNDPSINVTTYVLFDCIMT